MAQILPSPPSPQSLPHQDEKNPSTPQTTVTEMKDRENTSAQHEKRPAIGGALPDLLLGAFLPCIPLVIVSTLLLALIFRNRVQLDPGWQLLRAPTNANGSDLGLLNQTFELKKAGGHAAYYVRINPAILAAIAAWSSKIIPWFTGSSMAVIAFFAGRRILNASMSNKPGELPTPHQMSILINLLNGAGFKSLLDTAVYRWQNHESLVQPVPLAFGALSFLVVLTLLLGAADTWFAAATKPINVGLLTRHPTPVNEYGRNLNSSICADNIWWQRPCPSDSSSLCNYPCSLNDWNVTTGSTTTLKEGVAGAQQGAETLLGNSQINIVHNTSMYDDTGYGAQQYHFLGDATSGAQMDFLSGTVAVSTHCGTVTQYCDISPTGEGFSCFNYQSPSLGYSGKVGVDPADAIAPDDMPNVGIQFFKDSNLQSPIGFGNHTTELFSAQNPLHFLIWSKGFPPMDPSSSNYDYMRRNKNLQTDPKSGDNIFILNCSSTIYTTTYAWVNNTILHTQNSTSQSQKSGFYPTPAPPTYGAIFSAPFAIDSALGHLALEDAAAISAYKTSPQELADIFAAEFSHAAVALSAGIMVPKPNLLEQTRNNTELLTRVPLVPLYFLISLKAVYALFSLSVAALAVIYTRPTEAQEVKARLTVNGLAAGLFEPRCVKERPVGTVEELYGEHQGRGGSGSGSGEKEGISREDGVSKIGMRQTEAGGWMWVASGRDRDRVGTGLSERMDKGNEVDEKGGEEGFVLKEIL